VGKLRTRLDASHEHAPQVDYFHEVIEYIFHTLCFSIANRYPEGSTPKIHHWLPLSYVKQFSASSRARKERAVNSVTFSKNKRPFHEVISDKRFAHKKNTEGNGFYHLAIEYFFSIIESQIGTVRSKIATNGKYPANFSSVVTASFFISQIVRTPSMNPAKDAPRSIDEIVNALIEEIEKFKKIHCIFAIPQNRKKLVFAPEIPQSFKVLPNGIRIMYFPFASNRGFVITDRVILNNAAIQIVEESNISLVKRAKKRGATIYGVDTQQVAQQFI
jgi:hypothetical protein